MNIEFHYWITGLIAEHAGFTGEEAQVIAYSSQFVDDNDCVVSVYEDENDVNPSYESHVSQTMNILLPRSDIMKIYPLFHFIPGDQDKAEPRFDKKTHPLLTTKDSSYANSIMQRSLQSAISRYTPGNTIGLHLLGITTHSFVDTWAHQNFIGWFDDMNAIGSNIYPNVGHADGLHHPDWVSHRWNDDRLKYSEIDNISRFLSAAKKAYLYFLLFQQTVQKIAPPTDRWNELEVLLKDIFGGTYSGDQEKGSDNRIEQYKKASSGLTGYDEHDWLDDAVDQDRVFNSLKNDFEQKYVWKKSSPKETTNWFKFQEAINEHISIATDVLKPVFAQARISV